MDHIFLELCARGFHFTHSLTSTIQSLAWFVFIFVGGDGGGGGRDQQKQQQQQQQIVHRRTVTHSRFSRGLHTTQL